MQLWEMGLVLLIWFGVGAMAAGVELPPLEGLLTPSEVVDSVVSRPVFLNN